MGNLTVDSKPPVTGISKGGSTGLNLNQQLFVGGVPDFSSISSSSGFKSGFVGCLSYLVIDGKVAELGKFLFIVFYFLFERRMIRSVLPSAQTE